MIKVDREVYVRVMADLPQEWDHPTEASNFSVMQHVTPGGVLVAQAIYFSGETPTQYFMKEELADE
jgi:hypothetical protein